jgi:hypothetical protein
MDQLQYKPDWPEAKQRLSAWWRGENLDRCLLTVRAPRDDAAELAPPRTPLTIEQRWCDLDYLCARNDYRHRTTFYGAEAIPVWDVGYPGHVSLPTFYGCPFTLDWETGWHDPILTEDELDVSSLKLDRQGRWWQFGLDLMEYARKAAAGKSIPSMCAIFGGGDTLGMLRGNQRLLIDLMDDPGGVRDAELKLMEGWFEVFSTQVGALCQDGGPYTTWFGLWAPGRYYPMQCDVSYGISPEAFRECFVPALKKQAEFLDFAIYHLDGVGAFHLVDEICQIEGINAIQVLPGAGKPSPLHYLDILKRVQRLGKRLHISIPPEEVELALSLLSSRGLCIDTSAARQKQAQEIIDLAGRLSVDRG